MTENYFGEDLHYHEKEYDLSMYQLSNGGIALLPYDSDDTQEATSLCALLAQKINAPEKQKFFEFARNMYTEDILTSAMRLAYIQSGLKDLNFKSSFVYELDGKKEKVTLEGKNVISMFLTAKKLSEIRFSDIEGSIITAAVYKAPLGEISKTDNRISITRTYRGKDGIAKTSFAASDYIKVTLKVRFDPLAPSGYYMVEDYLPASLKYVSAWQAADRWAREYKRDWYLHQVDGQKVSFSIYHANTGQGEVTIEYFVRAVNIGKFTADHAAVYNLDSNIINYAPRALVEVK